MQKIILIRHSLPMELKQGAFLGQANPDLSSEGFQVARNLAQKTRISIQNCTVYSSPLQRSLQTAYQFFQQNSIQPDSSLQEINFGLWEGKTFDEIQSEFPEEAKLWIQGPDEFSFPLGESLSVFQKRIEDFIQTKITSDQNNIVIFSHAGVIRYALCYLLSIPYSHHRIFQVHRPSINVVDLHDGFAALSGLNLTEFKLDS